LRPAALVVLRADEWSMTGREARRLANALLTGADRAKRLWQPRRDAATIS
jgi:hypothetical protein